MRMPSSVLPDSLRPEVDLDEILIEEPEEEYHSKAGKYLSSHLLGTFRHCPRLYKLIVDGKFKRPDSPAFVIGSAVHTIVLEGEETYLAQYTSGNPINPTTGEPYGEKTKTYATWAELVKEQGLKPISKNDELLIQRLALSVSMHVEAQRLLESAPYRERVVRTICLGLDCQSRLDSFGTGPGIVDLKSCQNLDKLIYQARDFGYIRQLSFYRMVLRAAGIDTSSAHLIGVEKQYPYRCGVWKIPESDLDLEEESNQQYMKELQKCQEEDFWPTRYEDIRILSI